jgi:hypothetical protein
MVNPPSPAALGDLLARKGEALPATRDRGGLAIGTARLTLFPVEPVPPAAGLERASAAPFPADPPPGAVALDGLIQRRDGHPALRRHPSESNPAPATPPRPARSAPIRETATHATAARPAARRRHQLTVRLPDEDYARLIYVSSRSRRTYQDILASAVAQFFDRTLPESAPAGEAGVT